MIQQHSASEVRHLALVPNRSLSWSQTKWAALGLSLPLLAMAVLFTYAGLWPVLPFVVATVLSLWVGLRPRPVIRAIGRAWWCAGDLVPRVPGNCSCVVMARRWKWGAP